MKTFCVADAEDKITREAIAGSAAKIVGTDSVLAVVRSGILAHTFPVATLARDVSFNQDIKAVTPKNGSLLPAYLFWILKGREDRILRIGVKKGATVHSLSIGFLEALAFPLPPLDEQRRIVGLLDRAAEIRRRADAARAKARAIIPALFLDMFGDPATNPKGWPIKSFGDLVTNQDSRRQPVKASDRDLRKGEYPYYGASGIIDYVDDYLFDEPALLIAEDGANLLARSTPIAFQAEGKYWVNNHAHVVTPIGKAELRYLEVLLNLRNLKDWITGSAQPKLNQANLNRIPIVLPPLPLQTAFAEQAQRLDLTARALDAAAAKAEAMAASLSAEIFETGSAAALCDAA